MCVTCQAMARYIWPADEPGVRRRVVASLGVLVAAKLLNTAVPFILAAAVDGNYITACHVSRVTCHAPGLNTGQLGLATPASTATTLVTATLLGYGGARAGALGLNELR